MSIASVATDTLWGITTDIMPRLEMHITDDRPLELLHSLECELARLSGQIKQLENQNERLYRLLEDKLAKEISHV